MATFELIPYRAYLSQSKTWMHKIKADIKVYTVLLSWIAIFILSYYKLLIVALSLIITSCTIRSNRNVVKKHLLQTLAVTFLTTLFSFSIASNYKHYALQEQSQYTYLYNTAGKTHKLINRQRLSLNEAKRKQFLLTTKPALYFFITIYSVKLVMLTTSPEILAITIYKVKRTNRLFNEELMFIFLLSSHIVTNIITKLDKINQVISLRGNLNIRKHSSRFLLLILLISKVFFFEITKESKDISQALYTRNLNRSNDNFLKIYKAKSSTTDFLSFIIGTAYFTILFLV